MRGKQKRRTLGDVLVERELVPSLDDARRWIMAGQVIVDGQRTDKVSTLVPPDATIRIRGLDAYASRGGMKLEAALTAFHASPTGLVALDAGASTGGFTDCLLRRGARVVYAVEAGHGQLVGRLRIDPRVRNMERTNIGSLAELVLSPKPRFVTLDLSYLSLTDALPQIRPILDRDATVLTLFKPLFEVDDAASRRSGTIDDPALVVEALARVLEAGHSVGLMPQQAVKLAIAPRHGVEEFFLQFHTERPAVIFSWDALRRLVVDAAGTVIP